MQFPVVTLPRAVPEQRERPAQTTVPQTAGQREALRAQARAFAAERGLRPPLSAAELRLHTAELLRVGDVEPRFHDFAAVLLSNEVWRETLATVPYERRLLLLPKCLRVEHRCPAPFDEFGLLCKQCGLCTIQDLQAEAERLGYAVLVAEGSALVMALIRTGKIDAVVGVSCLSVLERAAPHMEAAAVPGIAIPLLQDDCADTNVDVDWVWDALHLTSDDRTRRLDLEALRRDVDGWFHPDALERIGGPAPTPAERTGREWLGRAGKRWRPWLVTSVYQSLQADPHAPIPPDVQRAGVAVECFHKASLVHDDIEDGDAWRSGQPTLHETHGVPVALNVGDLLVGEGYRLLAECEAPAQVRSEALLAAARGHRRLCIGQGAELAWVRAPQPLTVLELVEIFRQKTAPAFEVALQLGACLGGASRDVFEVLARYSTALGIAYQIRDDLDDLSEGWPHPDLARLRPTMPLALAYERSTGSDRQLLERFWRRATGEHEREPVRAIVCADETIRRCRRLLESYKEEAVQALAPLEHPSLKGLLRRVVGKIFQVELQGWCGEFQTRNAAGRAARPEAAG